MSQLVYAVNQEFWYRIQAEDSTNRPTRITVTRQTVPSAVGDLGVVFSVQAAMTSTGVLSVTAE